MYVFHKSSKHGTLGDLSKLVLKPSVHTPRTCERERTSRTTSPI